MERCADCHSADTKRKGGLLLDSRDGWAIGGDSGPAVVPGDPGNSLLLRAVSYEEPDLQMPPKNRLSEAEIADLRQWIADGAYDPRAAANGQVLPATEQSIDVEARKAAHWAWQAVASPALPAVENRLWARQSLDTFVLAGLEAAGLEPNEEAAPQVLVRRLFFDLIGLPPEPAQVKRFLADSSDQAYRSMVDELLQSPHFGERWGQHWLDIVRFAETWGHEQDFAIPQAWRYRNYVVRAFNADVPYQDLLVEHIAGDLVDPPRIDPERRTNESIQGTGFWHLGEATHSPVDIRDDECTRVSNQIDVFSKAFVGLTVMCARCHDHKFDAITTQDYYALFGYLQSSNYQLADIADPEAQAEAFGALTEIQKDEDRAVKQALRREYFLKRAEVAVDWSRFLTEESGQPGHPLYPLAMVEDLEEEENPEAFEKRRAAILKAWAEEERRAKAAAGRQTVARTERKGELDLRPVEVPFDAEEHVVADFGARESGWYVSGHRFGARPAVPGQVRFAEDGAVNWVSEPAAHADRLSEKFSGFLRTKTFEVVGDRLWIRYRGRAKVFFAVDSHRVCQGPLHSKRLRRELKGNDEYRWVAHDLSKYIGHRIHVEFTPLEGFSLSRVQFGNESPVERFRVNGTMREAVSSPLVRSRRALNAALNRVFDAAVSDWSSSDSPARASVSLAEWVLLRSGLLDLDGTERLRRHRERFSKAREAAEAGTPEPIRALALMDGSPEEEPVCAGESSHAEPGRGAPPISGSAAPGRLAAGSPWKRAPAIGPAGGQCRESLDQPGLCQPPLAPPFWPGNRGDRG